MGSGQEKRFPRLEEISGKVKISERIIRSAYNKMARSRNFWAHRSGYDLYKTKRGWRAKFMFILLAEKLLQKNIDPALYIKVMCRYGKYKHAKYMPHPTWFAKDSTIEKFMWVYRKERKTYDLDLDWKRELDGWSELDIYASIRDSIKLYRQAVEGQGIEGDTAIAMLWEELSPWFLAVYTLKNRGHWRDFRKCVQFLGRRMHVRHIASKAWSKGFQSE